ncbi:MAG: type II secretion system protein [Tepidisphaeraceae bacterium]
MRARRGWVLLDVLMGMIIVAILGAILGGAAAMHQRGMLHLQDSRTANRLAESALLSMKSHQSPTASSGGELFFQKLPDSQVPGMSWVEVRAAVHNRTASLIGLVPQDTIPVGEK